MVVLANRSAIPKRITRRISPGRMNPTPMDHTNFVEVFHGTSPHFAAALIAKGFFPSYSEVSGEVAEVYGVHVPLVHVSTQLSTAIQYPTQKRTPPCAKDSEQYRVTQDVNPTPAGYMVSNDGTYPIRCVMRCVMNKWDFVWKKGVNGATFPDCIWCTHFIFIAVHPTQTCRADLAAQVQCWQPYNPEAAVKAPAIFSTAPAFTDTYFSLPEEGKDVIREEARPDLSDDPNATSNSLCKQPIFARSVVHSDKCLAERSQESFFEKKFLLENWTSPRKVRIRIGQ